MPETLIGLIDTPVASGAVLILRSVETRLMYSISSRVCGLPASNSMPAYRSSVFSRTMTRSTGTFAEEGADAAGNTCTGGRRRTARTPGGAAR